MGIRDVPIFNVKPQKSILTLVSVIKKYLLAFRF